MVVLNAAKDGLRKSFKLCLKISKIIIPVYVVIEILKYSGVLTIIAGYLNGVMGIFGLPGEASLVLIFANSINMYAGIGALSAIESVTFSVREVTILAVMIGLSHSLPVETSIIKEFKVPRYVQVALRMSFAIIAGILLNLLYR